MQPNSIENILAAKLNLDLDFERISKEILDCKKYFIYTPPYDINLRSALTGQTFMIESKEVYDSVDYIEQATGKLVTKNLKGPEIFYLTRHITENPLDKKNMKYSVTKSLDHDNWSWRVELKDRLTYTINAIESLPFYKKIGCVRTFIMKDTFLATHRDYGWEMSDLDVNQNIDRCLGLSLIPMTGNVDMQIINPNTGSIISVPGNAMLFNDSIWHGVPVTTGYRITIRIFGEVNFNLFESYLDKNFTFYR